MKHQCTFEPKHNEMARHIASGIFNSGIVQTVRVLCQFGSVVILSRLLPPSDFGLMAMVSPVYGFVVLFQDLGLSQATIQKPNLTHGEVNAFFWINVAAGALLAALVLAVSPLVGWYFGDPRVVPLTSAMALLILVGSAGNQPGAILTRRMEFGVAAWTGVLGAVAGLAISIIMALIIKNYWALYIGMAVGTVVPVAGVWIASGWMPSAPRRVAGLRDMLRFGAGVTTANVSSYFSMNTDNILIGWRWGEHVLGLYDRAYKLLLFPIARIIGPVMGTMVPVLSRLAAEPDRYRQIFLKTIVLLTLATWPGIVWAIILKDSLVPTLLGQQWAEAA
jgi:PST family polysaccharide transporter